MKTYLYFSTGVIAGVFLALALVTVLRPVAKPTPNRPVPFVIQPAPISPYTTVPVKHGVVTTST